jgi:hypothetical protein
MNDASDWLKRFRSSVISSKASRTRTGSSLGERASPFLYGRAPGGADISGAEAARQAVWIFSMLLLFW